MANGKPTVAWFVKKPTGPVKWCKHCSRKHATRTDCGFRKVTRTVTGGKVDRWALPEANEKSTKKSKARKS